MEAHLQENINTQTAIQEDEIDLRELFKTIGRYKWFILLTTIIGSLAVSWYLYLQTPYYKTTTTIEIKPKEGSGGGGLGGAAALLGIAGGGSAPTSTDRDAAIMQTFEINSKVLQRVPYGVRYFIKDGYKKIEVLDNNLSISNIQLFDKSIKLKITPIAKNKFELEKVKLLSNESLGVFEFEQTLKTEDFSAKFSKNREFEESYEVILNKDLRTSFESIKENLSIASDKKLPFISISYLDSIPLRGEAYLKNLIYLYTMYAIEMEKSDANVTIDTITKQMSEAESKVEASRAKIAEYKEQNSIGSPEEELKIIVAALGKVEVDIATNDYKEDLANKLYNTIQSNKSINSIAPSLMELQDEPTIKLIDTLQTLQLKRDELSFKYKSEHPDVMSINKQIKDVEMKIKANVKNLNSTISARGEALENLKESYNEKLSSAPAIEKDMKANAVDNATDEQYLLYLKQKLSASQIKRAEAISKIRVIEPIYTDNIVEKPKKALILAVAVITLLILSIFMVFIIEFMKNSKHEDEEQVN